MSEPRPKIPVFEKEVIEADAKKRGGDYDKVSTTSVSALSWQGVTARSRYGDAAEMELMLDMIEALRPEERACVAEIFCDSKRGNDFSVTMSNWDEALAHAVGRTMDHTAVTRSHGHSGIIVHRGDMSEGGPHVEIEADFSGE